MTLGYSRRGYAEDYLNERMYRLLSAHERAFAHFGGVCQTPLYDRMRTVSIGTSEDDAGVRRAKLNATFQAFAGHWGFTIRLCRPYRAQTKATAESFVQVITRWVLARLRHERFDTVAQVDDHQVAVEFRHESWFQPDMATATLDWLRALGAVHMVVDGPQGFVNCVPPVWEATHPGLAILRLHGRNTATWNVQGAVASSSRFDYVYREDELGELVLRIESRAERVDRLLVVFNTNNEDQGQRNGRSLVQLLRRAGLT